MAHIGFNCICIMNWLGTNSYARRNNEKTQEEQTFFDAVISQLICSSFNLNLLEIYFLMQKQAMQSIINLRITKNTI